jgi:hypothetical protein
MGEGGHYLLGRGKRCLAGSRRRGGTVHAGERDHYGGARLCLKERMYLGCLGARMTVGKGAQETMIQRESGVLTDFSPRVCRRLPSLLDDQEAGNCPQVW